MSEVQTVSINLAREEVSEAEAHWIVAEKVRKGTQFAEVLGQLWERIDGIFALELYCVRQHVRFCVTADKEHIDSISSAIYTSLPNAVIEPIDDFADNFGETDQIRVLELLCRHERLLRFICYDDLQHDNFAPLLSCLSVLPASCTSIVQFVLKPLPQTARLSAQLRFMQWKWKFRYLRDTRLWLFPLIWKRFKSCEEKAKSKLFGADFRMAVIEPDPSEGTDPELAREIQERLKRHLQAMMACFRYNEDSTMGTTLERERPGADAMIPVQARDLHNRFYFSAREMAGFCHPLPIEHHPYLSQVLSVKSSPPPGLPTDEEDPSVSIFGNVLHRHTSTRFGIRQTDRAHHLHILGKSGSGKSKLLELLCRDHIRKRDGFALLDCHGDITDHLLAAVPRDRIDDVVLLDFSDTSHPPLFNPFRRIEAEERRSFAGIMVDLLCNLEGFDFSERSKTVILHCLIALMAVPETSIAHLVRVLADKRYREGILEQAGPEVVDNFFSNNEEFVNSVLTSPQIFQLNRLLGRLIATNTVSRVLETPENAFNFKQIVRENAITLIRLPKESLGGMSVSLVGSMVIGLIHLALRDPAVKSSHPDKRYFLYIDEFQNFASLSFVKLLESAEKDGISYTLAHQTLGQLSIPVQECSKRSIENRVSFQLGGIESELMQAMLGDPVDYRDVMNLDARTFMAQMTIAGEKQNAFCGRTLDVSYPEESFAKESIAASRERYAQQRDPA